MSTFEQDREYYALTERIEMNYVRWIKDCGWQANDATWSAFFYAFKAGIYDAEREKKEIPKGFYDKQ